VLKHTHASRAHTKDRSGGFTLVELLVVIVILGILAGVAVLAVSGISDRGDASACKSEKRSVSTAVEAYYAKENKYATDTATLKSANFLDSDPKYWKTSSTGGVTAIDASKLPSGCS